MDEEGFRMKFEFVKTQENGDATSNYIVMIQEGINVDTFLDEILYRNLKMTSPDRGQVYVCGDTSIWDHKIAEFDGQYMEFLMDYFDFKERKIQNVRANGGWGAMSYYLTLE